MKPLFCAFIESVLNDYRLPCSEAVVQLLFMIAAHESGGFRYVQQRGNGPAKGLLQMELIGLKETRRYMQLRPEKFSAVPDLYHVPLSLLIFDTRLAIACARIFFMAKPAALPEAGDIEALAQYAKQHWNTEAGKATWEDYADAYRRYG